MRELTTGGSVLVANSTNGSFSHDLSQYAFKVLGRKGCPISGSSIIQYFIMDVKYVSDQGCPCPHAVSFLSPVHGPWV